MVGPFGEDEPGVSQTSQLDAVPVGFTGLIMTDHFEIIGPEVRSRWPNR